MYLVLLTAGKRKTQTFHQRDAKASDCSITPRSDSSFNILPEKNLTWLSVYLFIFFTEEIKLCNKNVMFKKIQRRFKYKLIEIFPLKFLHKYSSLHSACDIFISKQVKKCFFSHIDVTCKKNKNIDAII